MLYKAGRGYAQSHCCIHQPSSIHVDPCSVGVGQEAHLAEVVDREDPASRAAVSVLQVHELTDWMVGTPRAPRECPL